MKKFPKLYKKSSTGKISEWSIRADDSSYTTTFGYIDGVKQTTTVQVKVGKNIGKTNETTLYQQSCSEAESKWNRQKDKGYCEQLEQTNTLKISPQLAHSYDDYKHKVKWPCYVQAKLDGLRCLAYSQNGRVVLQSRQGKLFKTVDHISEELNSILPNDGIVLDGELYTHGEAFQELIHLIKRDEPDPKSVKVEYHVYDMYDIDRPGLTFKERLKWLNKFFSLNKFVKIIQVETNTVANDKEVWEKHSEFTKDGYEGAILRNADGVYQLGHRSSNLLKVKKFMDGEFTIVGGYANKGRAEKECTLICKTDDGTEFGVKPDGTSEERQWYLNHLQEIIGQQLTVSFFSWTTSDHPVPRFGIGKSLRNYE